MNCINIGLGARLVKLADDAMRLIGSKRLSLLSLMIVQIFERKAFTVSIDVDKEHIKQDVMSICIGNCHGYGQTPNSVPYNGLLDMSIVTRPKWWQLFEGFWLLGKGHFLNYRNVYPYRAAKMVISDIDKANISLDGRILIDEINFPMSVKIVREKINFIVPL